MRARELGRTSLDACIQQPATNRRQNITCDDRGVYWCHNCGSQWRGGHRYQWWPVRLRWTPKDAGRLSVAMWGWQTGWDGIEMRVFGRSIRIGPITVCFGKDLPSRGPKMTDQAVSK
jgi:hypothetical protein